MPNFLVLLSRRAWLLSLTLKISIAEVAMANATVGGVKLLLDIESHCQITVMQRVPAEPRGENASRIS